MLRWLLLLSLIATSAQGTVERQTELSVQLPRVIEDGAQVPLRIQFDAPMSAGEYLHRLDVLAAHNPEPAVISFEFMQAVMPVRLATRIRLRASQRVKVIARSTTGRVWQTDVDVRVALSGCLTGPVPQAAELQMHSPRVAMPEAGLAGEVRTQIRHPMENGYRDGVRDPSIQPSRVQYLHVSRANQPLMSAEFHAGMAAHPYVSLWLNDTRALSFSWEDLDGRLIEH